MYFLNKLFYNSCSDILVSSHKYRDFLKQKIVLLITILHRILLIFGISVGTSMSKQKQKMIFTSPYYLSRVKGYSKLLLCEAPKCTGWIVKNYVTDPQTNRPTKQWTNKNIIFFRMLHVLIFEAK